MDEIIFYNENYRLYDTNIILKSGVYEVVYFKWPGTLVQDFATYNAYNEKWDIKHVILYKPNDRL